MRKSEILVSVFTCLFLVGVVIGAPRNSPLVTKTALNEGNTRLGLAVSCSSNSWTTVVAARAVRRSVLVQSLSVATELVCLSTFTTSGYTCSATTPGITLGTRDTISDSSEQALYCRTPSGADQNIKRF